VRIESARLEENSFSKNQPTRFISKHLPFWLRNSDDTRPERKHNKTIISVKVLIFISVRTENCLLTFSLAFVRLHNLSSFTFYSPVGLVTIELPRRKYKVYCEIYNFVIAFSAVKWQDHRENTEIFQNSSQFNKLFVYLGNFSTFLLDCRKMVELCNNKKKKRSSVASSKNNSESIASSSWGRWVTAWNDDPAPGLAISWIDFSRYIYEISTFHKCIIFTSIQIQKLWYNNAKGKNVWLMEYHTGSLHPYKPTLCSNRKHALYINRHTITK